MNADIERLYQFLLQQMAADSYLESIPPGSTDELRSALLRGNNRRDPDLPTSGLTRFTKVQATEFVGRYEVVHQLSENPSNGQPTVFNGIPLNTGFSATLIRERGTENYTLAIRSTEIKPWSEGGDRERDALGADLALAWDGFAWAQIDTMEKYYSWLKSSGTLPPGARLDVTGYSLGGHLATVFTELHRADPAISFGQTVTFNAPGRGTLTQSDASMASALAFYRAVLANPDTCIPSIQSSAFGKYIAAKAAGDAVNGLSIYGDPRYVWAQAATQLVFGTSGLLYLPSNAARTGLTNGAEMITTQVYGREFPEDRSLVANSGLHGPARSVFVEGQPRAAGTPPELYGTGDYGGGHSIVLLADSLALMRGLNQLDAAQTIDSLGQILVRASSRTPDSKIVGDGSNARAEFDVLENALDALRRALLGSDVARTPYATGARGFGDISARDGWYNNLNAVTSSAAFASLVGKVTIVPVNSANAPALAATAKVDFGDLVALQTFSPFTIKPSAGDPAAVGALTAVWQSGHGIDYAAWQADAALTTQQRAAGNATFSDAWYADRSTMLRWLMKANEENIDYAANGGSVTDQSVMQPVLFQDLQSETTFTLSRQPLTPDATGVGRVIFGRNDAADAIYGADANDRLYGGGGSDALHGQDGNDYLEGNAGNDDLRGGARNDILVGGAGGDELRGEGGNDRLLGGSGSDVYFFNSGDGLDTIVDTDGQIVWDGQALTGGFPVTGGAWRSADRQFTYSIHDDGGRQTLYIKKAGSSGTIAVENFSRANRDLSIWLSDMPGVTTPPTTTRNITGDLALLDTDPTSPGLQTSTDDIGNTFRSSVPAPGFADFFMDSAGNDRIRTGGGADFIAWSRGGSDDVDAGDGNDGVSSGSGDDLIAGGNGADELVGGDGSDVIIGGADDDVILTEHEIAYDSSTYALVVPPGASVVRNWTYDGRFASSGYGIQVVQYTLEGITFESPWVGIGGWIERRDATAHDFVDAGDGSDLVYGGYGSDVILGGNGSDRLEGSGGDDLIDGGSGNDVISGDSPAAGPVSAVPNTMHGSDQLFGGSGDDLLLGGGGSDILDGGDDDDVLYGDIAAMNLAMPVGTPFLEPTAAWIYGADILRGGAGNDRIHGEAGDDVLIGGPGDDTLMGDEGNDVFEFDRGDGADQVFTDSASNPTGDELHFGAGIDSGSTALRQMGFDLQIDTGVPADSVRVKNWFRPGMEQQVVELHFADGTVWTRDQINAQFVLRQTGTAGADTLSGFRGRDDISGLDGNDTIRTGTGADLIEGGKGNDSLDGGLDSDRYVFRAGDGADVITANDQLSDDVLQFVGVLQADVTFARAGDALVITASNGTDKVTINRYFEASNFADSRTVSGVQTIEFDGGVRVGVADIRAMFQSPLTGTANSDYLIGGSADEYVAGAAGNDTMFAYGGNDTLLGGDGNDYLDSGLGADLLDGGPGDDTLSSPLVTDASRPSYLPPAYLNNGDDRFVFGRGYGHDSVAEDNPSFQPSNDAILLKDLLPSDVAFGRGDSGNLIGASNGDKDLLIRVHGSSDYLRVVSFFDENPRYWIESIVFADGSTWGRDQVIASLSADLAPTSGSDYLLGSPQSDSVDGGAGSDVIWLGDGNDAAEGGDGDDHLQGGSGSDFLSGDAGSDQLYGGTGADVLDGGPGDDYLFGGIGLLNPDGASDTFVFRRGSGHDTIPFTACSGDADTVYLDGLGTADIELGWTIFNALQIRVLGTDDVLQVENQFDSVSLAKLETIRFGDGATYDATTIENLARQNRDDLMTGSAAADVLDGGRGNDDLRGGAGNDTLLGGPGDDRLDGETGVDIMDGGAGNDFFIVDDASDAVIEGPDDGVDRVAAKATFVLPANVEALSLIVGAINGTGNSLDNSLTGSSAANRLDGGAGNDVLDGGAGADTMLGGPGDDTFYVDSSSDTVTENANEGTDLVIASVTRTLGVNQEHLALSGAGAINGTGNSANNYLKGNSANNTLNGSSGTDALQGGGGNDTLTDTNGRGVHDGGDGDDTLTGGTDRQFFAGGVGNDTLTLGGGADLIAFNRGQGADAINAPTTGAGLGEKNDLISLSGVAYGELRLARESTDLVLKVAGTTDSIRLKNWYGSSSNQTVSTLQVLVDSTSEYNSSSTDSLRNRRVVRLNFGNLVSAFDAAGSPTDWSIPQSNLTAAYVAGSDVDAIGGLLAYRYARDGNLASVDFATAVTVLNDANFATGSQAVGNGPTSGGVRLMNAGSSESAGVAEVAFANASEAQPGEVTSMPAQLELVAGVAQPARRWMLDDHEAADPLASSGDRVSDWVTARPVQRYVTQDDRDAGVPTGGVGATYLTPRDVEGALQGIDPGRSAGRALFETAVLDASATMRQWILAEDSLLRAQIRGATPLLGAEGVESAPPYSSTSMALLASGEFNVYHGRRSRLDVLR